MSFYSERVLPHVIDAACSVRPVCKQRQKIVPQASGEVLEIGFGSGLNLPYYRADAINKIWALEPSAGMRKKAAPAVAESPVDVEFIDLPGEEIPLPDDSMDTIVVTYSLCTIPDVMAALEGMRRVLKPGGRLLYCEHGMAPDVGVTRWQRRLDPAWTRIAGGCHMDRDIPTLLQAGGFDIKSDHRMYIPGARVLSYNYWGSAVARE